MRARSAKTHTLIGADGKPHVSAEKGILGGRRGTKIFGRLDCPAALRAHCPRQVRQPPSLLRRLGNSHPSRYRPCAVCMPDAYQTWKARQANTPSTTRPPQLRHQQRAARPVRPCLQNMWL